MAEDSRFLIISGLSGAGKSVALHALEDSGYYCVDNLPVGILANFANYMADNKLPHFQRVAIGIDARNHLQSIERLPSTLRGLDALGIKAELVFMDANDDALLRRFSETRRRHPLSAEDLPLVEAIAHERSILDSIAERADIRIDTTRLNVHQLRTMVRDLITQRSSGNLALQFRSFGFKNGVPSDADYVFDIRCLPNPYWEPELRDKTGREAAVVRFLDRAPLAEEMARDIAAFLSTWINHFDEASRSYLTIAFGCTGGRHRSVYMAERIARYFRERGKHVVISHRDT